MASFNPQDFGFDEPPPRPTTPPVRRGFLVVLLRCSVWPPSWSTACPTSPSGSATPGRRASAGRGGPGEARQGGIVNRASALFRMATTAVSPAVVNVQSFRMRRGGEGFPGLPLGGNRMTPGSRAGAGIGRDHRQGKRLHRHQQPRRQGRRSDHGPARARATMCRRGWSVPTPRATWRSSRSRPTLKVQAEWGDSDKLDIGEWVLAIGSPLGFDHSVTRGHRLGDRTKRLGALGIRVVHSDRRGDQSGQLGRAADQPGRQGRGHQHGHHHQVGRIRGNRPGHPLVAGAAGGRELDQERQGRARLPRRRSSGPLDTRLARKLKLPNNRGALVIDVQPGSPASEAGSQSRRRDRQARRPRRRRPGRAPES